MADLSEKLGELVGQLKQIQPALETLSRNQEGTKNLVVALQRDVAHLEKDFTKHQGNCSEHWERIYAELKKKLESSDVDPKRISDIIRDVADLKIQGCTRTTRRWEWIKMLAIALLGSGSTVLALWLARGLNL